MTRIISKTEFRRNIGKYIELAHGETIVVTSRGEPKWVLISAHEYDSLLYKRYGMRIVK